MSPDSSSPPLRDRMPTEKRVSLVPLLVFLGIQGVFLSLMARWSFLAREPEPLIFAGFGICAGLVYGVNLWILSRGHRMEQNGVVMVIWGSAILFRFALFPAEPGDDIWRYLWEGAIQWHGHNPYLLPPADPIFAGLHAELPYSWRIGHDSWPAIYPPLMQMILAISAALLPTVALQKVIYTAADLGTMFLVGRFLSSGPRRTLSLALYGWNPLLIISFAGHAHFDSLMLLPLVGASLLTQRLLQKHGNDSRSPLSTDSQVALVIGTLLGLAISIKMMPLALLPVFGLALWRINWRLPAALFLAGVLPLVFSMFYGFPAVPIYDTLREFTHVSRTNDLFWWISERLFWANPEQKNGLYNVLSLLLACVVAVIWRRDFPRALLWVTGLLIILSPALHPWYVTWLLPFAIWRRSVFWIIFSVSTFAYFLLWQNSALTFAWEPANPIIWGLQIVPAAVAAILWRLVRKPRRELVTKMR